MKSMDDKEVIKMVESQIELINFYKPFLKVIPGIQEPDCTKLFQQELNLNFVLQDLKRRNKR